MHPIDDDVLVLGGTGVDTVVYVPQLPLPYADSYLVPSIHTRAGQTGDGVALGLHALGLRVHLLDLLGDDHEGDLVRELHQRHGVRLTTVPSLAGTKRAVNLVDPAGRRLSLYDISRAHDGDRLPAGLVRELAGASRHVHVCITNGCRAALAELAVLPATVSTDLHDWDGVNPYHEAFAYAADIVFLSATALTDVAATMRRIVTEGRAHTVVATAGAEGGWWLTGDGGQPRRFAAAALPGQAVDSNGAGDAFVSGYLFGLLAGQSPQTCVRYGAIAGAHACTVPSTQVRPIGAAELMSRLPDRTFTDGG